MLKQKAIELGIHPSCRKQEPEPVEAKPVVLAIDLKSLKFKELKEIAKEKGLKVPFGAKKTELIKLIKGD